MEASVQYEEEFELCEEVALQLGFGNVKINSESPEILAPVPIRGLPTTDSGSPIKRRRRGGDIPNRDRSQILEDDQVDPTEYVRGVGRVVHERPRPPSPPPRTPPPSRTDAIELYVCQSGTFLGGTVTWEFPSREFEFLSSAGDRVAYTLAEVRLVEYSIKSARFVLGSDRQGEKPPLCMFKLANLEVGHVMRFRSTIENCVVNSRQRTDEQLIDKRIAQIQLNPQKRKYPDQEVSKSPNKALRTSLKPKSRLLKRDGDLSQDHIAPRGVSVLSDQNSMDLGAFSDQENNVLPTNISESPAFSSSDGTPDPSQFQTKSPYQVKASAKKTPVERPEPQLPFKAGDCVFRLRPDPVDAETKMECFSDDNDIYDGPFLVDEVKWDNRSGGDCARAIVKLDIHQESKANPWVSSNRLRRAYVVPSTCTDDMSAQEKWSAAKAASAASKPAMHGDCGSSVVSMIDFGNYVQGDIDDPDSVEEHTYEVNRLRRKRLKIQSRREFPNEPQDDPDIMSMITLNGPLPRGKVAVVYYLVHWAGWPSEDDSWERAYGNIAKQSINDFRVNHRQHTLLPKFWR